MIHMLIGAAARGLAVARGERRGDDSPEARQGSVGNVVLVLMSNRYQGRQGEPASGFPRLRWSDGEPARPAAARG
jgi:hypothetical protein